MGVPISYLAITEEGDHPAFTRRPIISMISHHFDIVSLGGRSTISKIMP